MKIIATLEHYINEKQQKPLTIKISEERLKELIEDEVYINDSNNGNHNTYAKVDVLTFIPLD